MLPAVDMLRLCCWRLAAAAASIGIVDPKRERKLKLANCETPEVVVTEKRNKKGDVTVHVAICMEDPDSGMVVKCMGPGEARWERPGVTVLLKVVVSFLGKRKRKKNEEGEISDCDGTEQSEYVCSHASISVKEKTCMVEEREVRVESNAGEVRWELLAETVKVEITPTTMVVKILPEKVITTLENFDIEMKKKLNTLDIQTIRVKAGKK